MKPIALIGAPSSAGAYAPGQEKTPSAFRRAGLISLLQSAGHTCHDYGDTEHFRWTADRQSPKAMNVDKIHATATQLAPLVARAHANNCIALVIGGDCTVELGVVAGALQSTNDVGMIYIDFDADLNTPETTTDGALDWMGVAHMLGLDGTVEKLRSLGPHIPMLGMDQVCLFGAGNIKPHEQEVITSNKIKMFSAAEVTDAPVAIGKAARNWASRFEKLVVHLDVDIIDFEDFPIAENVRRKQALRLDTVMTALSAILEAPNLTALTVCEINPDHSSPDGHDLATFGRKLAAALG